MDSHNVSLDTIYLRTPLAILLNRFAKSNVSFKGSLQHSNDLILKDSFGEKYTSQKSSMLTFL
jgi:hypothetical protein